MKRNTAREYTFKLLFMSDFYDKKEISDELLLYFDMPFPFDEDIAVIDGEDVPTFKESLTDEDRQSIIVRFSDILDKVDDIDKRISEVSKGWKIDRIGKVELAILRLAVYEIVYDDDIPASVAINEAVEIAKKFGPEDSYAFVNGVLARFA